MSNDTVIANFPAYKIIQREQKTSGFFNGVFHNIFYTPISVNDSLGLKKETSRGSYFKQFKPGSVVSYAMQNGECPITAIDYARKRQHPLHWINGCGSMLTNHQRDQETWIHVWEDMLVCFEGQLFKIKSEPNDNLKLVPFELPPK